MTKRAQKLLVIGLDGATFRLISPWINKGLLPNIAALIDRGASGELCSTIHPLSPPAWTSFFTGKNPGKHGIFDFILQQKNSYAIKYSYGEMINEDSIWKILSRSGKRVIVMNVPMTYPPEEVNGLMISGFDAPGADSAFTYPESLYEEILEEIGEYHLRDHPTNLDPDSYLKQIHRILDNHKKTAFYLARKHDWDFFMVTFMATDHVQHFYWQYMDEKFNSISLEDRKKFKHAILDVYIKTDSIIGEFLKIIPENSSVMIMSDHGAGPCYKVVFLDQWLRDNGYLSLRQQRDEPTFTPLWLKRLSYYLIENIHLYIRKYIPKKTIDRLVRSFPGLRQNIKSYLVFSNIDWSRTRAYSFGRESTSIYINVKGKFPMGTVSPDGEYEILRDEIINKLKMLRDHDTGQLIVDRVLKKEEVYFGERLQHAPDLLVLWKDFEYTSREGDGKKSGALFLPSLDCSETSAVSSLQKGGTHRMEGIVVLSGEKIKRGEILKRAKLIDLAPTILYLLDVPIPDDMDGKVLKEAILPEVFDETNPKFTHKDLSDNKTPVPGREYSEAEESLIEQRLKSLGYID